LSLLTYRVGPHYRGSLLKTRFLISLTAIALAGSTVEAGDFYSRKALPGYRTYTVGGKTSGLKHWRRGSQSKLLGGIKNLISAPMEIPAAMNRGYRSRGAGRAIITGFTQGLTNMVRRASAGVADVATFPTKYPHGSFRTTIPAKDPIQVFRGSRRR
jgi:putative exosortase-associated protein (TIGR04073 family)